MGETEVPEPAATQSLDRSGEGSGSPAEGEGGSRPRVQSVARAIGILMAIAQSPHGLTSKEISARLRISRQTAYHLIHTLVAAGVITRSDHHRYVMGLRIGTLAEAFRRQLAPAEFLAPHIREIARLTGESAYAAGWWNNQIVIMGHAQGSNAVRAAENQLGPYTAANARASGKLMLAFATPEQRADYLHQHPPVRATARTLVDVRRLEDEFAVIRAHGYATDHEEFAEGVSCLAVPIDNGVSPFVFTISAPVGRFEANFERYLAAIRSVAATIASEGDSRR